MRYNVADLTNQEILNLKCHIALIQYRDSSQQSAHSSRLLTATNGYIKHHTLLKMKSYSVDFRQKIINVYHSEPISQREIAKRFGVAPSFVQKLLKQSRQTPSIAPQTQRCGGQLKLNPEQLVVLAELIETNKDATLEELCDLLHQKIGITISRATMGRMRQRLDMTFQKKVSSHQRKAVTECKTSDMSFGNRSES